MTLYILGNGFDRAHEMKTSYSDFKDWLIANGRIDIICEFQNVFNIKKDNEYLLWSDFEHALGEYDLDVALNWSWDNLFVTEYSIGGQLFSSPNFFLNTQLDDIVNEIFPKWVKQIPAATKPKFQLEPNAYFLTFNYTDTLERIYSIPASQILHIHGRSSHDEHLVVGHNNYRNPSEYWDDNIDMRENNERMQRLTDMNDLCKPIHDIIQSNEPFFRHLSLIDRVEVIGHSCAPVDYPYFVKVKECLSPAAIWCFNTFSTMDQKRIEEMLLYLNLNKEKIKIYKFPLSSYNLL